MPPATPGTWPSPATPPPADLSRVPGPEPATWNHVAVREWVEAATWFHVAEAGEIGR
jgi:hypothetical protein